MKAVTKGWGFEILIFNPCQYSPLRLWSSSLQTKMSYRSPFCSCFLVSFRSFPLNWKITLDEKTFLYKCGLFIFRQEMCIKQFSFNVNRKQAAFWVNFCTLWLCTQIYLQFFSARASNAWTPEQLFITTLKLCDSNGNCFDNDYLLGHKGVVRIKPLIYTKHFKILILNYEVAGL